MQPYPWQIKIIFTTILHHFYTDFYKVTFYQILPVKHFYRYHYQLTAGKVKMLNSNP